MIVVQDVATGYWTRLKVTLIDGTVKLHALHTHAPDKCSGRLCDVHNRRGAGPQATWPLNWREDRGIMEVICPCGIGHPTPAQVGYWDSLPGFDWYFEAIHGCCTIHCEDWMNLERKT